MLQDDITTCDTAKRDVTQGLGRALLAPPAVSVPSAALTTPITLPGSCGRSCSRQSNAGRPASLLFCSIDISRIFATMSCSQVETVPACRAEIGWPLQLGECPGQYRPRQIHCQGTAGGHAVGRWAAGRKQLRLLLWCLGAALGSWGSR